MILLIGSATCEEINIILQIPVNKVEDIWRHQPSIILPLVGQPQKLEEISSVSMFSSERNPISLVWY